MKKIHVFILVAALLLSTTVTGCSRLNNLLGISTPTPAHKGKLTHTPPAPGVETTPTVTPTP